jgi:PelA/Pel-15E family pectate lyase
MYMNKHIISRFNRVICGFAFFCLVNIHSTEAQSIKGVLKRPQQWYKSSEAIHIANNILLFQRNTGGWSKGADYFKTYSPEVQQAISNQKRRKDSTFDNDATYTELEFLVKTYNATKDVRYKDAFERGLDLIFEAQYENGGWPQFYPEYHKIWSWDNSARLTKGLEHFITYNDDAMVGVLRLLNNIAIDTRAYAFVNEQRKKMAKTAVEKGVECILKSQFYYDGRLTAWPAQVDEATFEPRWARSFEPPSIASQESVEIIRFLMEIENPDKRVINAIQSSIKWLDEVKILNTRVLKGDTMSVMVERTGVLHSGRRDTFIEHDETAPPIWARFYELNTFRPVFCSRDDTVRYKLADISLERRSGYAWYGNWPEKLLHEEYPDWCRKHNQRNWLAKN